jgi:hypothetical protein
MGGQAGADSDPALRVRGAVTLTVPHGQQRVDRADLVAFEVNEAFACVPLASLVDAGG